MPTELQPILDQWYLHRDKGESFCVIDVDKETQAIEVQYVDGDLEQFDFDDWHELDIALAEEPEDWTGPFDGEFDTDDPGYAGDDNLTQD